MCLTIKRNKHIGNTKIEILHCRGCFIHGFMIFQMMWHYQKSEMEPPTNNRSLAFRCSILYGWLTPAGPPTPMQGDQISITGSQTRAMLVHCAIHLVSPRAKGTTPTRGTWPPGSPALPLAAPLTYRVCLSLPFCSGFAGLFLHYNIYAHYFQTIIM